MSDQKRERLIDIQKREPLKGMLISKFKLKYGDKPTLSKYIDNEVTRFMKNGRLTEDNLRNLDGKIGREAQLRDKKDAVLADHKSERSGSAKPRSIHSRQPLQDDQISVRSSVHSRANSAKPKAPAAAPRRSDQMSMMSSQDAKTEVYSELAEDDEWAAI